MGLRRLLVVVAAGALVWTGGAAAATTQELTIAAADGTPLACALVEPDGTAPDGGWPALILFHGLGGRHADMEPLATGVFAAAGYASLMCDARGEGASGGVFGLDGPADVADTRFLFDWLAARPEVSDTAIGAFGVSLGGGAVWNAAVAGVPFRAIVPVVAWTNLLTALAPQGLSKSGLVAYLAGLVPPERWDPALLAARTSLLAGTGTAAVAALAAPRSPLSRLGSLTVPTLLIQGRHDFLFDVDQALAAYRLLKGPKALYLGDLGHPPAANPVAEQPAYVAETLAWLDRYVKGIPNGAEATPPVVLAHDPWDGRTTSYAGIPPTRTTSVALPGTTPLRSGGRVVRRARLTGGPLETFGDSTVTVRYSGASGWDRLVATLSIAGSSTPITAGGTTLTRPSGVVAIRLMDEAVRIPRGARLVLTLAATSPAQSGSSPLYVADVPAGATIAVGRATLALSVLRRAVSR